MKEGNFNEFVDGYISISLKAHREKQDYEFYFEYLLKAKFYVLAYKVLEELESKYGKVQDIQIKKARLLYKQNKYLEIMGLEGLDESEEYLYFKALAARRLNDKPEFLMAMEKGMKIATSNKNKPLLKAFYKVEPLV
jgi:hypothetical protein